MNYISLFMPLIQRKAQAIIFFERVELSGGGGVFYMYGSTCQVRHISLCIHRGPYVTGNIVFYNFADHDSP